MPITGPRRYLKLFQNVNNPMDYILDKAIQKKNPLHFSTKPNIVEFDVPESLYLVFKEIFMSDVYNINSLIQRLPAQPLVIDIGANAGFFDILLLSKINSAKILAYEPLESNIRRMELTAKANRIFQENVTINAFAVTGSHVENLDIYRGY
jgi:hypothetical protein